MPDSPDVKQRVIDYYNQEAERYIDMYRKGRMEQEVYPANDIRLEIIVRRLKELGARRIFDVGSGSGGPLIRFLKEGYDAVGIDFAPAMVEKARENLKAAGSDASSVAAGDLEKDATLPRGPFDAIIASGVFPHNIDDRAAYANLKSRLAPGGVMLIEYRNALMSLFSLNTYSEPFYWKDLLRADQLPPALREASRAFLAPKFDTTVESVGRPRKIEYTQILARFHNPLTLGDDLAGHGLSLRRLHYYHFHAAPPSLEKEHKKEFWEASLRMENPDDWRGMFMASAFVAEITLEGKA